MSLIRFTANFDDLSTDRGYQFRFHCDKCGNGFQSRFQPSVTGIAGDLLRAAGNIFGGILSSAGNSAYDIQRAVGGKAHDDAFAVAVEEAKEHFHQCTRCGRWVCPEVCWNAKAGLCEGCAPNYEEEFAASHAQAKADAAREQLHQKARETDYVSAVDLSAGSVQSAPQRQAVNPVTEAANAPSIVGLSCPSCGTVSNSKFCPECGQPMNAKLRCKGCGAELEGKPKFCKECGARIEYVS
ncbi:MAG TPA: zinc ribbon domain-containing protein [Blastocatellia bacterium]|nr:zinc ribbon domain-containing protein [Blastocatellia bacterium]